MLTAYSCEDEVSTWEDSVANDIPLTDEEVSQRILRIRAGWSVEERVARRKEAERRFAELVGSLADATTAA